MYFLITMGHFVYGRRGDTAFWLLGAGLLDDYLGSAALLCTLYAVPRHRPDTQLEAPSPGGTHTRLDTEGGSSGDTTEAVYSSRWRAGARFATNALRGTTPGLAGDRTVANGAKL